MGGFECVFVSVWECFSEWVLKRVSFKVREGVLEKGKKICRMRKEDHGSPFLTYPCRTSAPQHQEPTLQCLLSTQNSWPHLVDRFSQFSHKSTQKHYNKIDFYCRQWMLPKGFGSIHIDAWQPMLLKIPIFRSILCLL